MVIASIRHLITDLPTFIFFQRQQDILHDRRRRSDLFILFRLLMHLFATLYMTYQSVTIEPKPTRHNVVLNIKSALCCCTIIFHTFEVQQTEVSSEFWLSRCLNYILPSKRMICVTPSPSSIFVLPRWLIMFISRDFKCYKVPVLSDLIRPRAKLMAMMAGSMTGKLWDVILTLL